MYSEYFKKKNDRRRKRKTRLESPTIRTMRDGIAERSEGNDSAIELVEQLEVFADGTLDIFAREQSISGRKPIYRVWILGTWQAHESHGDACDDREHHCQNQV